MRSRCKVCVRVYACMCACVCMCGELGAPGGASARDSQALGSGSTYWHLTVRLTLLGAKAREAHMAESNGPRSRVPGDLPLDDGRSCSSFM